MEKRRLMNNAEMRKEKSKKISSKQLEAKITAFTIILAVIVMNILWWTGTQFLELNNNHNITKLQNLSTSRSCSTDNPFFENQHKKRSPGIFEFR